MDQIRARAKDLSYSAPGIREVAPVCPWCDRPFVPRRTGGLDQRFCRPSCCRALHAEARRWVLAELAAGRLPLNAIKAGLPATCALDMEVGKPIPAPEMGQRDVPCPEAAVQFV